MKAIHLLFIGLLLLPMSMQCQKRKSRNTPPPLKIEDTLFHGLKWRNIGPFRGGRSVTSTGVVGQPMTYYMGSTGGGIWKTTDDGITWKNVSDGFLKTGTVGALAVSESNPNIVVAGMGEHAARGVMTSMGDGVYKSTDAGKTWKHMWPRKHATYLRRDHPSRQSGYYLGDCTGCTIWPFGRPGYLPVHQWGDSWNKVLYLDDTTGAVSLSMDMKNPLILYAAMWQHRRYPWTMESGGRYVWPFQIDRWRN